MRISRTSRYPFLSYMIRAFGTRSDQVSDGGGLLKHYATDVLNFEFDYIQDS